MTGRLVLNCPGRTDMNGHYYDGCGRVTPIIEYRKIHQDDGTQRPVPVLVCPDCKTRLLPTKVEIERTRGGR